MKKLDSCINNTQIFSIIGNYMIYPLKRCETKVSLKETMKYIKLNKNENLIYGHFMGYRESTGKKKIYNTKCIMHVRRKASTH